MTATPDIQNSTIDALNNIQFSDLFILEDLQRLQDLFADAHGVASIITNTDGRPITRPSKFCRLCNDIIRKTEKGRANCFKSNAVLGRYDPSGPIVQPCLSGGLWNASASITVGGKHIANWIISQVRNEEVDEQRIIQYGDVIGANREDFRKALNDVPVMSVEQFNKVAKMLFAFANELSEKAYNNLLLKMQIAERVKATELLQKNEERFQLLFNKAPLGYQSLDFDGNFIEVNQQWLDILGYTREEVIGKWFGDYLSPVYQDGFHERFPIFKAQGTIHSEFEMVQKNGNKLFIAFEGRIGYDLKGEFKQTHCILQDITERKQAEESLCESRQILEAIINTIPVRVFWKDKNLTYLGCNTTFALDAGFKKQKDVIGKDDYTMGWSEQAELYRADDRLVIASGIPKLLIEEPQTTSSGEQIYLLTSKVPLKDATGEILGVLGTYLDITERKLAEEELRQSKRELSTLMANLPGIVYSCLDDQDWTMKFVSEGSFDLTGYLPDELTENKIISYEEIIHPDDRKMVWITIQDALEKKTDYALEYRIVTKSGVVKHVWERGQGLYSSNDTLHHLEGFITDITERKRAEAEQARLLYIIESSLNEIYIFDSVNLIFDYVSQGALGNLGYTREAIQGMTPLDLKPEFTEASFRRSIKPLLRHEQEQLLFNTVHRRADGSLYPVEVHLQLVELEDHRVFLAMILDITERKRTEEALRKSEAVQGKMVANIGDVIVIIDQDGINRYKSPNIEKWFGWNPEEVVGKSAWENIHPEDLSSTQKIFGAILGEPNATGTMECRYRCKDSSYKWIEFTGVNLLHDPDIRGLLGNYHDITEHKRADEKLGHVARLYALLSQINQAIIRTLEQDELFRTICQVAIEFGQFRMAWVGLTDQASDRIKPVVYAGHEDGYLDMILISTEDVPAGRGPTGSAFREGKIMSYNDIATEPQMLPWRDEAVRRGYRSAAAVSLSRKGKPVGTFTLYATETDFFTAEERKLLQEIGEDISYALDAIDSEIERKQSELKLQKKNEEIKIQNEELQIAKEHAEESDKLKTAFINNISHEIRTPFNGILGFLSILEDNNLTKSERDEYTSIINKSAYRLMNTINDIVEISQIQAGQMKLTASETNIKRLTGELFDLFKPDAESQGLEFTITNDLPNNIESISTDGVKLKTILSILIGNAIKFTKAGSIEFGIRLVDKVDEHAVETHDRASLQFSIKDTGIGISGNKQQAIFERFMQADCSSTRQFEGSGLGLSIAKAYVEMLGGEIWVESDPEGKSGGKGSAFYFTIPYNGEPEEKNVIKNVVLVY